MHEDAASRGGIPEKLVDGRGRRRLTYFIPIAVFAVIAVAFAVGLTLNPREIPSALIGKPVPAFRLPSLMGGADITDAEFKGRVTVLNVFASWCLPCRAEHPALMALAGDGKARIVGLNFKDKPEAAKAWLKELGNPYARIAVDRAGRVAIEWGVYGVPETFLIDKLGRIRHKLVGPITAERLRVMRRKIGQLAK